MKKIEINGVCKVEVYKNRTGDYSTVEINDIRLEQMLAGSLLQESPTGVDAREVGLCKVTITVEPHIETLTVNGVEMPLEL